MWLLSRDRERVCNGNERYGSVQAIECRGVVLSRMCSIDVRQTANNVEGFSFGAASRRESCCFLRHSVSESKVVAVDRKWHAPAPHTNSHPPDSESKVEPRAPTASKSLSGRAVVATTIHTRADQASRINLRRTIDTPFVMVILTLLTPKPLLIRACRCLCANRHGHHSLVPYYSTAFISPLFEHHLYYAAYLALVGQLGTGLAAPIQIRGLL